MVQYQSMLTMQERAWQAVSYAKLKGTLIVPKRCSRCKKVCTPEAHHQDYSFPLLVTWLCRQCHRSLHAKNKRLTNTKTPELTSTNSTY
jgi:MinD superfamily P-loop ATPase